MTERRSEIAPARGSAPVGEAAADTRDRRADDDLLDAARGGDGDAFRELIEPYRAELQVHCYRILGSVQDAEDLVQETLLAAWRGLGGFRGQASVRTWLYRIATNRCLNVLRAEARRPPAYPWSGRSAPREIGQASGAFMMLRILGAVFGVAVTVAVFAGLGGYGSPEEFGTGFAPAMGAVAGLALLGMLIALGMPRKQRAKGPGQPVQVR